MARDPQEKYALLRSKNVHDDLVSLLVRPSRQMVLYLQFLEGLVKELGTIEPLVAGLAKLKEVLAYVGKSSPQQSPRKVQLSSSFALSLHRSDLLG